VLDSARASSTRPPTVPTAAQHAEHLNELDGARLSLAKAINDAEGALAGKEAELARLKDEARALEVADPAAEHDIDGTPCVCFSFPSPPRALLMRCARRRLRLQIYKGLGFEPVRASDGRLEKMLVSESPSVPSSLLCPVR